MARGALGRLKTVVSTKIACYKRGSGAAPSLIA
jgi:hypothetical protein